MKEYCYELCVVFSPRISEKKDAHYASVRDVLTGHNSEITKVDDWGLRQFAQPLGKFTNGYYGFFTFKTDPSEIIKIQEALRLNENVIRFMTIKRVVGKEPIIQQPSAFEAPTYEKRSRYKPASDEDDYSNLTDDDSDDDSDMDE
jgi:small subunit ribosomal protein S6